MPFDPFMSDAPKPKGHIALVGAGPGAADHLTLRALARIQSADVVFFDRLVDESVLALIPHSVEQVYVGKEVGQNAWPQDKINAVILAEALKGRRVVRLKSGDPGIFGRASEEMAAARAFGVEVELVPGITAAAGAAASLGQSLTERGVSDTLVITTGQCREGDDTPDWEHHARPGTTLALYMSTRNAGEIASRLIQKGAPAGLMVDIVVNATHRNERKLRCPLDKLARHLRENAVKGSAMILVSWPKMVVRDSADVTLSAALT